MDLSRIPEHVAAARFVGRAWALAGVADWRRHGTESSLLIVGEPGSGKTALAAWLAGAGPLPADPAQAAQLAELREQWDAVHFCVTRGAGTLDPNAFTISLVQQLAQRHDIFAEAVIDNIAPSLNIRQEVRANWGTVVGAKVERLIISGERRAADLYQRAIREPLQELARRRPDLEVLILVDALDEAATADEPTIVTLLATSADLPRGVRFVLTSRDDPEVRAQFAGSAVLDLSAAEHAATVKADLAAYVAVRLAGASDNVVTEVVERAAGNFLYAAWATDELTTGGGRPAGLPKGLYGLYREFLARLVRRSGATTPAWPGRHERFFGSLTVAVDAAPTAVLPRWLDWNPSEFNAYVNDVAQVVEYLSEDGDDLGLRLYHRSLADFLTAANYRVDGRTWLNEFYVDPLAQHQRIVRYYLGRHGDPDDWAGDWSRADRYGLRHLVGHLAARIELTDGPARSLADDLYAVALDPSFQDSQRRAADGVHLTLADLRTTLDVALRRPAGRDLVPALRAIAAHRELVAVGGLSQAVFQAIAAKDFPTAVRKAHHYRTGRSSASGWDNVLAAYVAWEAAASGQQVDALDVDRLASPTVATLLDALLVPPGRNWPEADPAEVSKIVRRLEPRVAQLEQNTDAGSVAAASAYDFVDAEQRLQLDLLDPETSAELARSLQDDLYRVADDPSGRDLIERTVGSLVKNPYPRYRDLALAAAGSALLGTTHRDWARPQMERVLRAGLDDEGVTFTFDLPSVVLAEVRRRGGDAPELDQYLERARACHDVWGTSMRARNAQAAAEFHQGRTDQAWDLLVQASAATGTYAGFGALAMLALIDRCHEFGDAERAAQPVWGPFRDQPLTAMASDLATRVYDPYFRQERIELVGRHRAWAGEPATAETITVRESADEQFSRLLHLSARWTAPAERAGAMPKLRGLVPLVLSDGTTLDAILGRILAVVAAGLTDDQIAHVAQLTRDHFTTGRPWALGQWR